MNAKRNFIKMSDLSLSETREVYALAQTLKRDPKGAHADLLRGRAIAVILEKSSTRTRVSFQVGIAQLGAIPVFLDAQTSQLGRGEPIRDTARVLSRYCDAIVYRTFSEDRIHEMASGEAPVLNALSDSGHPIQVLCDVFTIEEAWSKSAKPRGIKGSTIAFVGDCASNMARSWIEAAALFDFELILGGPSGYFPSADELRAAGGRVRCTDDPREATRDADIVNTDVWTSMGQESENRARANAFAGWTVNDAMLAHAKDDALVLHCLPAHRGEEIDDATLEGRRSRVWDQAENRLHVQKGLLSWILGVRQL